MAAADDNRSPVDLDSIDHQLCYIFSSQSAGSSVRPQKRQKVEDPLGPLGLSETIEASEFKPLLQGNESLYCRSLRKKLYEQNWAITDARIKKTLNTANEKTVEEIVKFVYSSAQIKGINQILTGFVITGPNVAVQELLFRQISDRLKAERACPVVTLRSADIANLKSALKQLIRDATTLGKDQDDVEIPTGLENGRRLLNYDLKLLQNFVTKHTRKTIVIVIQDSESFDSVLLAELVTLLSSWRDRIPFLLLIGIGTSIDFFHDRFPRAASRCLSGKLFEVEQTGSLLERIFFQAVAGENAPLYLGHDLILGLLERFDDHLFSIQDFVSTIKYIYMCHYYFDALSILNIVGKKNLSTKFIQKEHLEAIRMLPSFRNLVEREIAQNSSKGQLLWVQSLLTDDEILLNEIERLADSKKPATARLLRAIHVLTNVSTGALPKIDIYLTAIKGHLRDSRYVQQILDTIKRMSAKDSIAFIDKITESIHVGAPEMDLAGWAEDDSEFLSELAQIQSQISMLEETCLENGINLKSSYSIHNKGIRTTVVAQRIQLSYETSSLSDEDKEFTAQIDRLSHLLCGYFSLVSLQTHFMSEVWIIDSLHHFREAFAPRPRAAVERALSFPSDYLNNCSNTFTTDTFTRQPATAALYQMYLESGSLVNIFDLWSAFRNYLKTVNQSDFNERNALVIFYRALADLKMLGIVKQSKRKIDHISKLAWKGI